MSKRTSFIVGIVVVALLLIFFLARDTGTPDGQEPTPDGDTGLPEEEEAQPQEYDQFDGSIYLNDEELDLENYPIVDKGLVYLPALELSEYNDTFELTFEQGDNLLLMITEDEELENPQPGENDDLKLYLNNTNLTPANIIEYQNDFYIASRDIVPLMGWSIYENIFANSVYITDQNIPPGDGEYVTVRPRDGRGWQPQLRLDIADGEITNVEYNEYDEDNNSKLDNPEYIENWKNQNPDVDPLALIENMENQLLKRQNPNDIDVATGATGSYSNFVKLSNLALGKARSQPDYQLIDGNYEVYGNPSERGWTPQLLIEVIDGDIRSFYYDEIDEDGNSKRENQEYLESWTDAYPEVDPISIIEEREEDVINTQDPNLVDATTGATSWGLNLKKLSIGSFIQADQSDIANYDQIYVFMGEMNARGDRPQLLLTTSGEELTSVDFSDYRNGVNKKFDEPYLSNWQEQYPDVNPPELVQQMEDTFQQTQQPDDLDAISGATSWRDNFKSLASRALETLNRDN
ncbi:hypothetical protein PRVXT_000688 [Proteinivorax tanatarense]|uniref:FMN-binding domain-containing protein n=1 Tax=Proteinivorax tanatarense TaxID=1260629 RepID=A0AAU7VN15_9FIRM